MFSLFTKKRHPASELYEHYSEEEKLTILAMLFLAGTCDNNLVTSSRKNIELQLLNEVVTIFEVKAKNSQQLLKNIGPDNLLLRLRSFEKSKIDIVLVMMMEMLFCDGPLNEEEMNFIMAVLDKLDIPLEAFTEQMEMNKKTYNFFMK
jgi:uncharacterized tellurite resistance protein B-like protein